MRIGLPAIACAVVALAATSPAATQSDPLGTERCRLLVGSLPAAFARCGTIAVPEDPAAPEGRTVELFVARIGTLAAEPRPDPLVLIAGGPGGSTVDMYLQLRGAFDAVRRERDLILVDQRGTGRSASGFQCAVPEDLVLETADDAALAGLVDDCLARLERDPRFYTTSVAVQDLDRVRAALGIERWNLYGASYGTRVAQHYLRRFPERVRTIVLDGVVPPTLVLGPDVARVAQQALEQTFARCAADSGCATRFPELPQRFSALLERLEAAAGRDAAERPPLGALELRALVRFMSYNSATVAVLPVLLDEAYEGRYAALATQATTLLRDLPEALSFPMSSAVTCSEDAPLMTADAEAGLDATYLGTSIVDAMRMICRRWPVGIVDADFREPLASDTPALLLSGENDPATPPAYAHDVIAGGLRNAVHVIGKGQGHGIVAIGCVPRILRAFLETPIPAELDTSCFAAEPPMPFFLSPLGPAP